MIFKIANLYERNKIFCEEFINGCSRPKYILGRNNYAESILKYVEVNGVVDDFTFDNYFCNNKIVRISDIEKNALVLNAAGGKTLSAKKALDSLCIENLDYFMFFKLAQLELAPIRFNDGFLVDYCNNKNKYEFIESIFADDISRCIYRKLINFRNTLDIKYLENFEDNQPNQYFENFINLKDAGEVFVDIGSFDGYTSKEFIKRAPNYKSIHLFEPNIENFEKCKTNLKNNPNIFFHKIGLSDFKGKSNFLNSNSCSKIDPMGKVSIDIDMLDNCVIECPTFLKLDIEGGEYSALLGSKNILTTYNPRIAVAVYHNVGDFWRIPELILSFGKDYRIYLRHYTESIYETIMFFIPESNDE